MEKYPPSRSAVGVAHPPRRTSAVDHPPVERRLVVSGRDLVGRLDRPEDVPLAERSPRTRARAPRHRRRLQVFPVVALPGYSRPLIRVRDYLALIDRSTFADDRVRPVRAAWTPLYALAAASPIPPRLDDDDERRPVDSPGGGPPRPGASTSRSPSADSSAPSTRPRCGFGGRRHRRAHARNPKIVPFNEFALIDERRGQLLRAVSAALDQDDDAEGRKPPMLFEHGEDARIGRAPIAAVDALRDEADGCYVRATLLDGVPPADRRAGSGREDSWDQRQVSPAAG